MKQLLPIVITSSLLVGLVRAAEAPAPVQLVFSPWLPGRQLQQSYAHTVRWLQSQAPAQTRVLLYDGWHLAQISAFTLPGSYRELKLRPDLARLRQWMQASARLSDDLRGTGALRTPEVLDELARSGLSGGHILFIGSPLYRDPREPAFNFVRPLDNGTLDYRFPGDGLLRLSRSQSPFGLGEDQAGLDRRRVHFLHLGESEFPDSLYKDDVRRFWTLYVNLRGAHLVQFSADGSGTFQNLLSPALMPQSHQFNPALGELMLHQRRSVESRDIAPVPRPVAPVQQTQVIREFEQQTGDAPFSIGLMWEADVDIDLHVIFAPGAERLYFGHTRSAQGHYVRDYTQANAGLDYEQVVLNRMPGPDLVVRANLYAVRTPLTAPVTGKFMVRTQGRTRLGTFRIEALTGNSGAYAGKQDDVYWAGIDVNAAVNVSAVFTR